MYVVAISGLVSLTLAQWDKGSIRGLGWSEDEKLLVVTEDGTVRCYYNLQSDFDPFSLGHVRRQDDRGAQV